ncbi:MAG: hypothetical protein A3J42_04305 [Candidatus Dadabacteria bacterium RIFCSPHIGHO2_12_FULL_53_21]|nr:MAG: hypothetical protein A3J42_04305 [Candidatus Dadabacteria bacterium RIFCSPHIGHO2_12_FULL_53_21]
MRDEILRPFPATARAFAGQAPSSYAKASQDKGFRLSQKATPDETPDKQGERARGKMPLLQS